MRVLLIDDHTRQIVYEHNGKVYQEYTQPIHAKHVLSVIVFLILAVSVGTYQVVDANILKEYQFVEQYREQCKNAQAVTMLVQAAITATEQKQQIPNITLEQHKTMGVVALQRHTSPAQKGDDQKKPYHFIRIWEWSGNGSIPKKDLSETIYAVMRRMGIDHTHVGVHDLILETAATESDLGRVVKQVKGPALSIYQILPSTYELLLGKLKKKNKKLYDRIMLFYDNRKGELYNYIYNIPFTTAMCLYYYLDVTDNKLTSIVKDRETRAKLWKQKYNTEAGKGTVQIYLHKTNRHLDIT